MSEPDESEPEARTAGSAGREVAAEAGAYERARARVAPVEPAVAAAARAWHDALAKPAGSLGRVEALGARLAAMAGHVPPPRPEPAVAVLFAADHGVASAGVTPWPSSVTASMVRTILAGRAASSVLAREVGAELVVVDIGVADPLERAEREGGPRLVRRKVAPGSADLAAGPALSADEVAAALDVGAARAAEQVRRGCRCLLTGEMGIGNTTAAAAVIAALTGRAAGEVTGRGTGVDDATLVHKVAVVRRAVGRLTAAGADAADTAGADEADTAGAEAADAAAVAEGRSGPPEAVRVLAEVGGLEIAGLAGLVVGAAAARVPVILDGVITLAAALAAVRLVPDAVDYCVAAHRPTEPGGRVVLDVLDLDPVLDLDLRLGEGTGALLALPIVRAAAALLGEMATLDEVVGRAD